MKESMWGVLVVLLGTTALLLLVFFQDVTNTDEHNSQLLKEVTEAAMWDAFDRASFIAYGVIKIDEAKFRENFIRRYADSAQKGRQYQIDFYDVNELPPKVSVQVTSSVQGTNFLNGDVQNVPLVNRIDAILEVPYHPKKEGGN